MVGLDPRPDLLPVELRGDVTRFCCGIIDAVAPHAVAVKPQLAFFEALGAHGMAAFTDICAYARVAGLLVIADGKRGDIGSTARAYADGLPRRRRAARRRADGQPVARTRVGRALPGRRAASRHGHLLRRQDLERGRRRAGRDALGRAADVAARRQRSSPTGAPTSSASTACPPSARWSARHTRAPSARRAGSCRRRCSSSRGSARRARRPPTSPAPSRAARRARSSTRPARSSTPSARGRRRLPCRGRRRGRAAAQGDMGRLGVVAAPERSWRSWRPFAGPVALLLAVTLVVAVVRASMHDGGSTSKQRRPAPAAHGAAPKRAPRSAPRRLRRARRRHDRRRSRRGPASAAATCSAQPEGLADGALHRQRLGCDEAPRRRRRPAGGRLLAIGCAATAGAAPPPSVDARAWLVENPVTGEVLASHAARYRMPIASITKLMTVLVALEHLRARRHRHRRSRAPPPSGRSRSCLAAGEELTVGDLVKGALIQSANDAADALALATAAELPSSSRT